MFAAPFYKSKSWKRIRNSILKQFTRFTCMCAISHRSTVASATDRFFRMKNTITTEALAKSIDCVLCIVDEIVSLQYSLHSQTANTR